VCGAQILQTGGVQHVLACVHSGLAAARHPRHARRALAPLRALLALLGDAACAPATLRYAVALLLRALHTPCGPAGAVCPQWGMRRPRQPRSLVLASAQYVSISLRVFKLNVATCREAESG